MTELFLGVDAGGTKTHAAVMNQHGELLGIGVAGTGNWERVGFDAAAHELRAAVDEALTGARVERADLAASSFALAGIDWPADVDAMSSILAKFGLGGRMTVMNDAFAVLYAGTPDGIGCASVAGTGGKTVARDAHQQRETLGMSLGEGGGAGQLVAEALSIFAQAFHGQVAHTELSEAILRETGARSYAECFQAIARDGSGLYENFAPDVFALAAAGDVNAVTACQRVAIQHGKDVVGLVNGLDLHGEQVRLVRAGGLHTAGSKVFDAAFNQAVAPIGIASVILEVVPVVGSLVHAYVHTNGSMSDAQRQRLFADAERLNDEFRNQLPNAS